MLFPFFIYTLFRSSALSRLSQMCKPRDNKSFFEGSAFKIELTLQESYKSMEVLRNLEQAPKSRACLVDSRRTDMADQKTCFMSSIHTFCMWFAYCYLHCFSHMSITRSGWAAMQNTHDMLTLKTTLGNQLSLVAWSQITWAQVVWVYANEQHCNLLWIWIGRNVLTVLTGTNVDQVPYKEAPI